MSIYRRNYVPGGTYFFTAVTFGRCPILDSDTARAHLRRAFDETRRKMPFEIPAIALLPGHLHAIWTLPAGDADYSVRWGMIKSRFTLAHRKGGGAEGTRTRSHIAHKERAVWQHRFWEHTVRDEDDFKRCLDYIHWNPVKHGLVERVKDYQWSSFRRWVGLGEYDEEWGGPPPGVDVPGAEWE